jgi:hypothetical protein
MPAHPPAVLALYGQSWCTICSSDHPAHVCHAFGRILPPCSPSVAAAGDACMTCLCYRSCPARLCTTCRLSQSAHQPPTRPALQPPTLKASTLLQCTVPVDGRRRISGAMYSSVPTGDMARSSSTEMARPKSPSCRCPRLEMNRFSSLMSLRTTRNAVAMLVRYHHELNEVGMAWY